MQHRFLKKKIFSCVVAFAVFLQTFFVLGYVSPVVNALEVEDNAVVVESNEKVENDEFVENTEVVSIVEDSCNSDEESQETSVDEEKINAPKEREPLESKSEEVTAETFSASTKAAAVSVSTYDALKSAVEKLSSGSTGEYLINANLVATSTITVPSGATVILTVNEAKAGTFYIARSQDFHGNIIEVSTEAALEIGCTISGEKNTEGGYASTGEETGGYYGDSLILNYGTTVLNSDLSVLKDNYNEYDISSTRGGAVRNIGTFRMSAGTISNNVSTLYGGGIYNEGTLDISGGVIESNTAYYISGNMLGGCGGGIYSTTSFDLPTGVIIQNNTAADGGGVYVYTDWEATTENVTLLTVSGAEITNNIAFDGAGVALSSSNMTMTSGLISGNEAGLVGEKLSTGEGGGISVAGNRSADGSIDRGILNFKGGTISNNTVVSSGSADGGGIYCHRGLINMSGGTITGNSTSGDEYSNGGGVFLEERSYLNMTAGTISNNEAVDGWGGGVSLIYYYDSTAVFSGTALVTENTAYAGGGVSNEYCGDEGGGVFIKENAAIDNNTADFGGGIYNSGVTTITGGSVCNNSCTKSGGGIYNSDTVDMSGGSIHKNSATSNGGGAYNVGSDDADANFIMTSGSVSYNTAGNHGAGLYFSTDGCAITLTKGSIYNNTATKYGGGICSYRKAGLTIGEGIKIYTNSGTHGGGVFTSTGLCTFNGEIKTNTASYGGGIYAGYNVNIVSGLIDDNTAKQKGGGLYSGSSAPVTMTGGTISNNYAKYDGGGLYCGGTLTMSGNSSFDGNTAGQHGAGIYNNSSTVNLNGGTVVNNVSDVSGGGVYNVGTLNLNGINIKENSATSGAGVFSYSGSVIFSSGKVSYNTAKNYGGGFLIEEGEISMYEGAEISYNKGTSFLARGAGVYNDGTFNIYGGTINNNTLNYLGTDENGNAYQTVGGGVYNNDDPAVTNLINGSIYGNVACSGGGVASYAGSFNMSGGKIYENLGYDIGGGISNRSLVVLTGGEIYSNQAPEGAGIYNVAIVSDGSTVTLDMSGDANVDADNEVYLGSNTNIYVSSGFNYDGLVAMIDCNKKAPGRIVAKAGYGNELGSELLYYDGTKQRFELVFDAFDDGRDAFLRAGDQGAASNSTSGISARDVFISTSYIISFNENVTGYNVTKPSDVTKLWCEDLASVSFGNASVNCNDASFVEWNTVADGSGDTVVSPIDYTDNADMVLYAQWEWHDYCVVVVPKVIVVDGATAQGTYSVKVKGQVFEGRKVNVSPETESVSLSSLGKRNILADVVQKKTAWAQSEINEDSYVVQTGVVSAPGLSAGKWHGSFEFNIYIG